MHFDEKYPSQLSSEQEQKQAPYWKEKAWNLCNFLELMSLDETNLISVWSSTNAILWTENWQKDRLKSDPSSFTNVHMSSSEFVVDLDAVLDEFESSQNLAEETETMGKKEDSENVLKPHLLEDLNALPESPPYKKVSYL